jgi:hypothetical protein
MAVEERTHTRLGAETVFVDRFCDGIIGPGTEMLGPVRDGGHIVANTAPGCWGPMITPAIKGGHEVTLPVAVEGAEVGDAVAIHIRDISVTSIATASGNDRWVEGRFNGDPYCAKVCARTRSCCSRRTTSSAWRRACARSWASSARHPRSTCPTRTTRATSARSCWARRMRVR